MSMDQLSRAPSTLVSGCLTNLCNQAKGIIAWHELACLQIAEVKLM